MHVHRECTSLVVTSIYFAPRLLAAFSAPVPNANREYPSESLPKHPGALVRKQQVCCSTRFSVVLHFSFPLDLPCVVLRCHCAVFELLSLSSLIFRFWFLFPFFFYYQRIRSSQLIWFMLVSVHSCASVSVVSRFQQVRSLVRCFSLSYFSVTYFFVVSTHPRTPIPFDLPVRPTGQCPLILFPYIRSESSDLFLGSFCDMLCDFCGPFSENFLSHRFSLCLFLCFVRVCAHNDGHSCCTYVHLTSQLISLDYCLLPLTESYTHWLYWSWWRGVFLLPSTQRIPRTCFAVTRVWITRMISVSSSVLKLYLVSFWKRRCALTVEPRLFQCKACGNPLHMLLCASAIRQLGCSNFSPLLYTSSGIVIHIYLLSSELSAPLEVSWSHGALHTSWPARI